MLLALENTAMHFNIQVTKAFILKQLSMKKIRKSVMLAIYSYFLSISIVGPTITSVLVLLNTE